LKLTSIGKLVALPTMSDSLTANSEVTTIWRYTNVYIIIIIIIIINY